jgi:hypothetical protein
VIDEQEVEKRTKIFKGLINSPERLVKVAEIAESFERLTNNTFNSAMNIT